MDDQNASPTNGQLADEAQGTWWDKIHADFQAEKSLEKFSKDDEGLNNIVKSYLSLESKMGTAINIPGETATDEEKAAFLRKLGVPESPDKYEIKYPDHDIIKVNEAADKEWRAMAHKVGLTPRQMQELSEWEFQRIASALDDGNKAYEAAVESLKTEWGTSYDEMLNRANKVIREFASDADKAALEPFANDVRLVRLFAAIGSKMGEHTFRQGDTRTNQDTRDGLKKKILDLQKVYTDDSKPMVERKLANAEAQRLFEDLYGNEEVSTSIGVDFSK